MQVLEEDKGGEGFEVLEEDRGVHEASVAGRFGLGWEVLLVPFLEWTVLHGKAAKEAYTR